MSVDADHGHLYAGKLECETIRPVALLAHIHQWREDLKAQCV